MSWNISIIGAPENVVKALEEESGKLSGQCKVEFDGALPHLVGLVKQNFNDFARTGSRDQIIKLDAAGFGHAQGDQQIQRSCLATLESFCTKIV